MHGPKWTCSRVSVCWCAKQCWPVGQAWWYTPVISTLWWQRQEDHELQASLGYIARHCLKKKKKKKRKEKVNWKYFKSKCSHERMFLVSPERSEVLEATQGLLSCVVIVSWSTCWANMASVHLHCPWIPKLCPLHLCLLPGLNVVTYYIVFIFLVK
jgi:hypothetical protein